MISFLSLPHPIAFALGVLAVGFVACGSTPSSASESRSATTLTVVKRVFVAGDRGRFNLLIDGRIRARAVGHGGGTGAVAVTPGLHRVSETAAPGTNLAAYTRSFRGACNSRGEVTLKAGEAKTCVIVNTPKSINRTALRVNKIVVPSVAKGVFNLTIDGTVRAANVGHGGTTGFVLLPPGPYQVGETGGTGTSIGDFVPSYSGDCTATGAITLAAGQSATCTITNTRMLWSSRAVMPTPRLYFGIGAIGSHIYVVGGANSGLGRYATLERYTPSTNTWSTRAPMADPRDGLGAGVINNILYAVGGRVYTSLGASVTGRLEAYNPATNTWTTKAPMPTPRRGLGVAVVGGILYAVGGEVSGGSHPLATLQAYNPITNTWTTKAPMPMARANLTAIGHGGKLYVIGGFGPFLYSGNLALVHVYDPATNSWSVAAPITNGRRGVAVTTAHGFIYAIGGNNGANLFNLAQRYDAATNTWTTIPPMITKRTFAGAATVGGHVFVIGGQDAFFNTYGTTERYAP
jgi:energy-converting hydrogenase Eha subunit A